MEVKEVVWDCEAITLILKVEDPQGFGDFRPISLVECM